MYSFLFLLDKIGGFYQHKLELKGVVSCNTNSFVNLLPLLLHNLQANFPSIEINYVYIQNRCTLICLYIINVIEVKIII